MDLLNICLAQTAQEKTLTILYISLFVVAFGMLVLDTLAKKQWSNKTMKPFIWIVFLLSLVALIVLIISANKS